jgi:hypothetical protein
MYMNTTISCFSSWNNRNSYATSVSTQHVSYFLVTSDQFCLSSSHISCRYYKKITPLLYWTWVQIHHVTCCNRVTHEWQMRAHPECRRGCTHMHKCVTLLQHVTCCSVTNNQYNTAELCMYLHTNSVYYVSYSILKDTWIVQKQSLYFLKIVEITSSKIKTCSQYRRITRWLCPNNSYLALLTRSCKPDWHMGVKNSTWHNSNHVQDTGFKERMRHCWIGSEWWQIFSDTLGFSFWNFRPMSGIWIYMTKVCRKMA